MPFLDPLNFSRISRFRKEKSVKSPGVPQKKEWSRVELGRGLKKFSPFIPQAGGAMYKEQQRKDVFGEKLEKVAPEKRYGTHLTELEAKDALRKLRETEYGAKTSDEKKEFNRQRRYLEEGMEKHFGFKLKGKY